jgi:hypothetical protein
MPTALEDYREKFREKQVEAPPAQEHRALRAALSTEVGQARNSLARFVELMKWPGGKNPDLIISAWQDAVRYFSAPAGAALDPQTGQRRPVPPYAFCNGSFCHTLEEAERGLAAVHRKIAEIDQARCDLAAAGVRLADLTGILAELDAEIAAAGA